MIRPGDTLLISFGHNDEKSEDPARYTEPWTTFQDYLRLHLAGARTRGAHPVLVTPVERRRFTADGTPYQSHGAIEVGRLVVRNGPAIPGRDEGALRNPSIPVDELVWPPARPAES